MKGDHTWPLYVHYHACPKCGFIIESREDYRYVMGKYKKELQCPRCNNSFKEIKPTTPTFGPLIGTPQPSEFDWS